MKTLIMRFKNLHLIAFLLVSCVIHQSLAQGLPPNQAEDLGSRASRGDAISQNALGWNYAQGIGVSKDGVQAVKWFRKAADQNLAVAQYNLGRCYSDGDIIAKDFAEAAKWFRKAAEQNLAVAQDGLGNFYYSGQGVAQDYLEAVKWFRKAADQNLGVAQNSLGICYYSGQGVAQDYAEAVKWFRKAAEQNHAPAQCSLGNLYSTGNGIKKNLAEAAKWLRKAAEQNYPAAQNGLGHLYRSGQGVKKDSAEAVKWYRKAAEQNYAPAQYCLGNCYYFGFGLKKDFGEAAKWCRKAAEQNYATAQCGLGNCYLNGQGVPKDYVEAYKWFLLAAGQGEEFSKKSISTLESGMTREQIAEGQKLARNFKPRHAPNTSDTVLDSLNVDSAPSASGTGFFITEDGFLITNQHVIDGANQVRLITSAGLISARVIKVDESNDLALLKAEGKFSVIPVTTSRSVKLGSSVATVGFPNVGLQGFSPKLAKGEIASLAGVQDDARYFQISVPVQPGNSGGALVDERGNVVGVVRSKLSASAALAMSGELPENVNYAVKSSFLLGFLESVPAVSKRLKEPNAKDEKFEDVVNAVQQAAVLVLVY